MLKRVFDIIVSLPALVVLLPFFLIIAILIAVDSKGGVLYRQLRVGRNNRDFKIIKFRTMYPGSDKKGLLTIGDNDRRITKAGYFLRKYKLDELPQLLNVLKGDMSLVGPRPETRNFVNHYNEEQMRILSVRPGITDNASVEFANESELLSKYEDPEIAYIEEILPVKTKIYLHYIDNQSFINDIEIIFRTVSKILSA